MPNGRHVITLEEFIIKQQSLTPNATGQLSGLLRDISIAAKMVNREVNKAGLVDILGAAGTTNIQGEEVKKLDVFANDTFINALKTSGECAGIASEENEDIIIISEEGRNSPYVVAMDPLDGSSNIDVNVSIGTIFAIYKRKNAAAYCELNDFMQPGTQQIAAGYVVYGSSTMLVYTTGNGVNGFTLDPSIGEFCLSHPDIKIPGSGSTYSLNQGGYTKFPAGVRAYIDYCQGIDTDNKKPYSLRYIGSMVADLHRNLIKGGIFIYPPTDDAPKGKLRLLYECNPMAFIVEQAGGMATDGNTRIMELLPTSLHQRTPIFIGNKAMVEKAESFLRKYEAASV